MSNLVDTFADTQRARGNSRIMGEHGLSGLSRELGRAFQSPLEIFMGNVSAIFIDLIDNEKFKLGIDPKNPTELRDILNGHVHVKNVQHVNPHGFVLGYLCIEFKKILGTSSYEAVISKKRFRNIAKRVLPVLAQGVGKNFESPGVAPEDLLRYALWWESKI